jgi:hypothetical protein
MVAVAWDMFEQPTAIIVGAGSGVEYRMPLGAQLAADVAKAARFHFEHFNPTPTSGDQDLYRILHNRFFHLGKPALDRFTIAGNALSSALSSAVSVDDALYQLSENQEAVTLEKICIFRSILSAESACSMAFSQETGRINETAGRDGWIEQIFSMAITGLKKSELTRAFENVHFINFNYDRCVEHYLFWSFQRIGVDVQDARSIIENLKMIRPYGSLGPVLDATPGHITFGYRNHIDPFDHIDRIRTYTESAIHDTEELVNALHGARLILFLGFGFHAQNLGLLQIDRPRSAYVMATVKKVHADNRPDLRDAIHRTLCTGPEMVELYDMTAPEMLSELRPKITMRTALNLE